MGSETSGGNPEGLACAKAPRDSREDKTLPHLCSGLCALELLGTPQRPGSILFSFIWNWTSHLNAQSWVEPKARVGRHCCAQPGSPKRNALLGLTSGPDLEETGPRDQNRNILRILYSKYPSTQTCLVWGLQITRPAK